jgi:hypothetical protein
MTADIHSPTSRTCFVPTTLILNISAVSWVVTIPLSKDTRPVSNPHIVPSKLTKRLNRRCLANFSFDSRKLECVRSCEQEQWENQLQRMTVLILAWWQAITLLKISLIPQKQLLRAEHLGTTHTTSNYLCAVVVSFCLVQRCLDQREFQVLK